MPHIGHKQKRVCEYCGEDLEYGEMTGWVCTNEKCCIPV